MRRYRKSDSKLLLSRRAFLSLSGMTLLAATLPFDGLDARLALPEPVEGRALGVVAVRSAPDAAAPVVRHLWPDSTALLLGFDGDWYTVPDGYVHRHDLQPMLLSGTESPAQAAVLPGWATVVAPVAPVRAWAAGSAPLVTRIGHGGVLAVVDALPGEDGGWYAVSESLAGTPLGWTPASRWGLCAEPEPGRADLRRSLVLDRPGARIIAREDGRDLLHLSAAVPRGGLSIPVQSGLIRQPAARIGDYYGAAWCLSSGGLLIYGAYWHHHFGQIGEGPGWELAPWAARWLYGWLPPDAPIIVV